MHFQVEPVATNSIAVSLSTNFIVEKGSVTAVYLPPAAAERDAASFAWSKAGRFISVSASTSTYSFPPLTDFLYQNRLVLSIAFAFSGMLTERSLNFSRSLLARS